MILLSHLPDEKPFSSKHHQITNVECVERFDYSRAVQAAWDLDEPLLIVEHDMEVSDDLIERLLEHPASLATYAYTLHWVSTHRPAAFAQRAGRFAPDRKYLGATIRENDQWCDFTGIGFCKIAPEARCKPLRESSWQHVDMEVNAAVNGRWAVLWPEIDHDHV